MIATAHNELSEKAETLEWQNKKATRWTAKKKRGKDVKWNQSDLEELMPIFLLSIVTATMSTALGKRHISNISLHSPWAFYRNPRFYLDPEHQRPWEPGGVRNILDQPTYLIGEGTSG